MHSHFVFWIVFNRRKPKYHNSILSQPQCDMPISCSSFYLIVFIGHFQILLCLSETYIRTLRKYRRVKFSMKYVCSKDPQSVHPKCILKKCPKKNGGLTLGVAKNGQGKNDLINALWPSDAIWQQRYGLTLAQVMACCLTAPSHYLIQCCLISKVQWHSSERNFTRVTSVINHWNKLKYYLSTISFKSPRGQWVNNPMLTFMSI